MKLLAEISVMLIKSSLFFVVLIYSSKIVSAQSVFSRNDSYDFAGNHYVSASGSDLDHFDIRIETNSDFRKFKLSVSKSRLFFVSPWFAQKFRVDMNSDGTWEQGWTTSDLTISYNYPNPPNGISANYIITIEIQYTNTAGQTFNRTKSKQITIFSTPRVYANAENNTFVQLRDEDCTTKIPVLLVEGFDPTNEKFPELYYNLTWELVNTDLYPNNYEVFILNFYDGGRDLRLNANVLLRALEKIHEICPNYKIAVAGLSMGGPITRYALAKKESQGDAHNVGLLLSYDSPQEGAHVNPDMQDWIKIQDPNQGVIQMLQNNLKSTAAKQMLRYNTYDPSHVSRDEFYNELNSLNSDGYPHKSYNVSVSNGNFNATWGYESVGRHLLTLKINDQLLKDVPAVDMDCGTGSMVTDITMKRYGDVFFNPFVNIYYELEIIFNPSYIPTWSGLDLVNWDEDPFGNIISFDRSKFDDYVVQTVPLQHHELTTVTRNKISNWLNHDFNIGVNYSFAEGGSANSDNYSVNILHGFPVTVQPKNVNINGATVTYNFLKWEDGNTSNPRTFYSSPNENHTATMKGHRFSTSSLATASNNQRKIAQTADGTYCLVYESMNKVWFTKSAEGINWSNEVEVSSGSTFDNNISPSIYAADNNQVVIVWQGTTGLPGPFDWSNICFRLYANATNTWSDIQALPYFTPTNGIYNASPVVSGLGIAGNGENAVVAWSEPTGIAVTVKRNGSWNNVNYIPNTNSSCINPSLTRISDIGSTYAITWEKEGIVSYTELQTYSDGTFTFQNPLQISPSGWIMNQRPTIATTGGNGRKWIAWQSLDNVSEGQSIHLRSVEPNGTLSSNIITYHTGATWGSKPVITSFSEVNEYIATWEVDGDVYEAQNGGNPYQLASGSNGGTNISAINKVVSSVLNIWERPNNTISVTTTGFQKSTNEQKIVPYRLNKHMLVYLDSIPALAEKGYKGMIAFEVAGLSHQTAATNTMLEAEKNGRRLQSKSFSTEANTDVAKLAGAYYAKGLVVPENAKLNEINNLVTVILRDVQSGEKVKDVWTVPFSRLVNATTTDGEFKTMNIPLTGLKGRNLTVDVELAGDTEPIFVDDYYIYGKAENSMRKFFAENAVALPTAYALHQNYPNPFNPTTTIRFDLVEPKHVTLRVYNSLGQQVKELVDGYYDAGSHDVLLNASSLSSGAYFYRITAGKFTAVKTLSLVK